MTKNKKPEKNVDFDVGIGSGREWTKKEFDDLDEFRRLVYKKSSSKEKLHNISLSFRYILEDYLDEENPKEIIQLGDFFKKFLMRIKIKQNLFAKYIDLTPQNFNKYIVGDRKFNVDFALKIEKIFNVNAFLLTKVQLKNEILSVKNLKMKKYDINDLLSM